MQTENLLIELFTEELPPKALKMLGNAFAEKLTSGLIKRGLKDASSQDTVVFSSPRRLAAWIPVVRSESMAQEIEHKLMPVSIGLDANGQPTPALQKKLQVLGLPNLPADQLESRGEGKAAALYVNVTEKPLDLAAALQQTLDEAISTLPVPKVMRYQLADGETSVQFVRPVHGLIALHGAEIVPVQALGLRAGRTTHGHRFQGTADIVLNHADEYEARLEREGAVIASFDKRRHAIERLLFERAEECGTTLGAGEDYAALLDEVTALVERPAVYIGQFEAEYLSVPAECLILTMKLNQKYFPLFFADGSLSSRFCIVSNMRLDNPQQVIEGNQRVVRPRLADAQFFFETDKKTRLEARIPKLAQVVYHNKLGNQHERMERVKKLATEIAVLIDANPEQAARAAMLAKADLLTDMVGEFPELQGIMGRYYALHDGEAQPVAEAIQQHYQPRFAGDKLPEQPVAIAVALADKLETLAGLFGIGQQPTGDKDPFALRRHALGVLRIVMEKQLALPLQKLIEIAFRVFPAGLIEPAHAALESFLQDRLRGLLRDQGYTVNEVEAVMAYLTPGVHWAPLLLEAVRAFSRLPEAESLAAANKRIGNILKKAEVPAGSVQPAHFKDSAEHALFAAMQQAKPKFDQAFAAKDFTGALTQLAPLKTPVDAFFEAVMVNADDAVLRTNRLALLNDLHNLMNKVADLSRLAA